MTKKPKPKQIIYIVINEAMPDYCKIGKTNDLRKRLRDLYTTSVPLPFEKHFACEVDDAAKRERWLHEIFKKSRVSKNREFFKMEIIDSVETTLRGIPHKEIKDDFSIATKTEEKEILKRRAIRSRFDFEKYGIKPGAEIYFSRKKSIKAVVLPKNQIRFKGKTTSLSQSATLLLRSKQQVAGTLYWKYEDETLDKRRVRMDNEEASPDSPTARKKKEKKTVGSRSFDFKKYGIEAGEEISLARDESIKAKILENNSIEVNGKEMSLTAAAVELLGITSKTAGPIHWMYKGEKLADRRKRMDKRRGR